MACLQLSPRRDRDDLVSDATVLYASPDAPFPRGGRPVTLLDLLDRLLGAGVVIHGRVVLSVADIDLIDLDLAILLAAHDTAVSR